MSCELNLVCHLKSLVGSAAKSAAGGAFDSIARDFASSANHITRWLWSQMSQATTVQLGGTKGWPIYLGMTAALALVIGVGLFTIQVTVSVLRRDPGGLARAGKGMLVAFIAGLGAVSVTEVLIRATDAISNGVMSMFLGTDNWNSVGAKISAIPLGGFGAATLLLVSLFMIFASVLVWLALTVRKLLLIITAIFAPVAFAGSLADVTSSWVRRWIEWTVALIASKLILVIVFVVGIGVLDHGVGRSAGGGVGQQATQLMVGLLILCLAGFAPWAAVRVVHFAGDSYHAIAAHHTAVTGAAATAATAPQKIRHLTPGLPGRGNTATTARSATNGQASQPQSQAKPSTNLSAGDAVPTPSLAGVAVHSGRDARRPLPPGDRPVGGPSPRTPLAQPPPPPPIPPPRSGPQSRSKSDESR